MFPDWSYIATQWIFLSQSFEGAGEELENLGIGSKHAAILAILETHRTPADLRRVLGAPGSTITSILNELEKKGMVVRTIHPDDRRKFLIERTPLAYETLEKVMTIMGDHLTKMFSELSGEEMRTLEQAQLILCKVLGISPDDLRHKGP